METELLTLELTPAMLALVPTVAFVVQLLKKIPAIAAHHEVLPLASILLGVGAAFAAGLASPVVSGIAVGLSASGGYSLLKNSKR